MALFATAATQGARDDVDGIISFTYDTDFKEFYDKKGSVSIDSSRPTLLLHGLGDSCQTYTIQQIFESYRAFNHYHDTKLYVDCINLLPDELNWLEE